MSSINYSDDEEDDFSVRGDYDYGVMSELEERESISRSKSQDKLDEFPLHTAVNMNDIQQVQLMLDSLPSLSRSADEQGRTALHLACKMGRMNIAELILSTSSNVNAQDCTGKTCLHYSETLELTTILLDSGCNPNIQDDQGYTPLHLNTITGNISIVKLLLQYGADPTICDTARRRTVIHIAVESGNPELLASILLGSRHLIQLNIADIDGNSPIHLAAFSSNRSGQQQNMMTLLLDRGASALVLNNRQISALHFVCANRFLCESSLAEPLAEILIDQGGSPNAQDCDGCTPLVIAAAHREWGLCKLLLEAGGDLNIPCPMNCYMLSHGVAFNSSRDNQMLQSDCTASDLLPRKARTLLFPYICVVQTFIPERDHCMNCGEKFGAISSESIGLGLARTSSIFGFGPTNGSSSSSSSGKATSGRGFFSGSSTKSSTSNDNLFSTLQSSNGQNGMIQAGNSGNSIGAPATNTSSSSGKLGFKFMTGIMQSLKLSSGKHHCRICNRVVCQDCSSTSLPFDQMPDFFQENNIKSENEFRVCKVCHSIQSVKFMS